MDAVSQSLTPRRSATLPVFNQQVERSAAGLSDTIEPLKLAAKFEAENIGWFYNKNKLFLNMLNTLLIYRPYC